MPGRSTLLIAASLLLVGCFRGMVDQPRVDPLEANAFFEDNRGSRHPPEGVVGRDQLQADQAFYTGREAGELVGRVPIAIDGRLLNRGREQFNIFCSPCHGLDGYGEGMVVQRGFPAPPSFHTERLRQASDGHIFDVITNGLGAMSDYADKVAPGDRWAIVAYVRALQLSQNASLNDVPENVRQRLLEALP